jgi:hypothetical protein
MPSSLNGLRNTLAWRNFTPKDVPAPDPADPATLVEGAHTEAKFQATFHFAWDDKTKGYKVQDNIVVTIQLVAGSTWVAKWVPKQPQAVQTGLLKHEQGHYDIVALMGRDLYNAIVKLEANSYPDAASVQAAVDSAHQAVDPYVQPIQDRYDLDTGNGQNADPQTTWNGYISTAFGQNSSTFLELLGNAGIQITP